MPQACASRSNQSCSCRRLRAAATPPQPLIVLRLAGALWPEWFLQSRCRRINRDWLTILPLRNHKHRAIAPAVLQELDAAPREEFCRPLRGIDLADCL